MVDPLVTIKEHDEDKVVLVVTHPELKEHHVTVYTEQLEKGDTTLGQQMDAALQAAEKRLARKRAADEAVRPFK